LDDLVDVMEFQTTDTYSSEGLTQVVYKTYSASAANMIIIEISMWK
jgi:hypothetical protein